jgi:outer membrane protein OmpA-like peptidoglycan-associated protein
MTPRFLILALTPLVAAAPLPATGAPAQPRPAAPIKSSEQIRCELADNCVEAGLAVPADAAAGEDDGATRKWIWVKPPAAPQARQPGQAPAAGAAPARLQPGAPQAQPGRRFLRPARPAAPQPANLAAAAATPATAGKSLLSINFQTGSSDLTEDGRMLASNLLEAISDPIFAGKRFLIAGHTDATGTRAFNLALSRRRAETLAAYLVDAGFDRARLDMTGHGFERPLEGTRAIDGINRRVEIAILP